MPAATKITYYDLIFETTNNRLSSHSGRALETERLNRVLERRQHNNAIIIGPNGCGKTSLVRGIAAARASQSPARAVVEFAADNFHILANSSALLEKYQDALIGLPPSIIFFNNFGALVYSKPALLNIMIQLLKPIAEHAHISIILECETKEYTWLEHEQPHFIHLFETIVLKQQPVTEIKEILTEALRTFSHHTITAEPALLETIIELCERFPKLGALPAAGVNLLDDCVSLVRQRGTAMVTEVDVYTVIADKTNIPLAQLRTFEKTQLQQLETTLAQHIIGQDQALHLMSTAIKRAKLGLKNPDRPLGSFLVLGPSGVGKTETAKIVAEKVFGKKESFVRIDMSEFGEAHTVARLIGAPAGYVGFDSGGGLTNAVKQEPHSLILLDEIEKAHPKIFDVFLQILDDGRLTSGQSETVPFTQTIIMATSNIGVSEIIAGFKEGLDIHNPAFISERLMPALTAHFRLEFLNRFDAIMVFKPLTENDLLKIAELEIKKIEARVANHKVKFKIDPAILRTNIAALADPRFGARPIKRFIETTCENLVSEKLLE